MPRSIQCKECLAPHETVRKDTKYCPSCSLLRVMLYVATRRRRATRCNICNALYLPHRSPDSMNLCGSCLIPTLKNPHNVDCAFCRRSNPGPDRRVRVCFPCIRDPKVRPRVIEGLVAGQKRRKEANTPNA